MIILFSHEPLVYEPLSDSRGLVQKFSSIVADENADSIILVRIRLEDGRYKYSLRRRDIDVDLGALVAEMRVGGGIPPAAGCTVDNPEQFEQDFKERVLKLLG